jgi:hypothetical protein
MKRKRRIKNLLRKSGKMGNSLEWTLRKGLMNSEMMFHCKKTKSGDLSLS